MTVILFSKVLHNLLPDNECKGFPIVIMVSPWNQNHEHTIIHHALLFSAYMALPLETSWSIHRNAGLIKLSTPSFLIYTRQVEDTIEV